MSNLSKKDLAEAKAAGALAMDILQNRLHLPLDENNQINIDLIEDQITIGLYSGELQPISQSVFDLAVSSVQEMVDIQRKAMGDGGIYGDEA